MTGKQKCKILKEIRRQIAAQNDIRYVIEGDIWYPSPEEEELS